MSQITMRQLLEAGVHFGHQTKRWNPKMKPYIFGDRNGIYIIDLQKTMAKFKEASEFVRNVCSNGSSILFVGTKKQAQQAIHDAAIHSKMFYVTHRWLGGMLTNFTTIKKSVERWDYLEDLRDSGGYNDLGKKEIQRLEKERMKLERNLKGIRTMIDHPGVVFVVDTKKEHIAVREANKLGIPVVAIVDTNSDPTEVEFPIPGNDDAIRAIRLITEQLADAAIEGHEIYKKRMPSRFVEKPEKETDIDHRAFEETEELPEIVMPEETKKKQTVKDTGKPTPETSEATQKKSTTVKAEAPVEKNDKDVAVSKSEDDLSKAKPE
ncbi:30S ribosomal protein S2 [bacterium]|nr:30S ribosomal protein S2 [candidate division CSSED10-310 bacterium]